MGAFHFIQHIGNICIDFFSLAVLESGISVGKLACQTPENKIAENVPLEVLFCIQLSSLVRLTLGTLTNSCKAGSILFPCLEGSRYIVLSKPTELKEKAL